MRRIRCDYATLRIYWGDTSLVCKTLGRGGETFVGEAEAEVMKRCLLQNCSTFSDPTPYKGGIGEFDIFCCFLYPLSLQYLSAVGKCFGCVRCVSKSYNSCKTRCSNCRKSFNSCIFCSICCLSICYVVLEEEREFVNAFLTALDILIYIIILYYSIYYIKNEWRTLYIPLRFGRDYHRRL